jgi:hypothetical protein
MNEQDVEGSGRGLLSSTESWYVPEETHEKLEVQPISATRSLNPELSVYESLWSTIWQRHLFTRLLMSTET